MLLTGQESKVIKLVVQNRTNQQIADDLGIARETVKTYKNRIYRKLQHKGIHTQREMVAYFKENGVGSTKDGEKQL